MVAAGTVGSKICTSGPKFGVSEVGRVGVEVLAEIVADAWLDADDVPNASMASTT